MKETRAAIRTPRQVNITRQPAAVLPRMTTYTAQAGQTELDCPDLAQAAQYKVYKNGLLQQKGKEFDYRAYGTLIVFSEELQAGDRITIETHPYTGKFPAGATPQWQLDQSAMWMSFKQYRYVEPREYEKGHRRAWQELATNAINGDFE